MANRIPTSQDEIDYGSQGVVEGEGYIYDTKTNTSPADFIGQFNNETLLATLSGDPIIIWIADNHDAKVFGFDNQGGSNNYSTKQVIFKPLHVSNVPVEFGNSNLFAANVASFALGHMEDYVINGETSQYPGLSEGLGLYPHDNFGFRFTMSNHIATTDKMVATYTAYSASSTRGIWRGIYFSDGFAALRMFVGNNAQSNEFLLERCFMDYGKSEGTYIGMTSGDPRPRTKVTIRDSIIVLRGAESLQNMHMLAGSEIYNCVIIAGGTRGHNAFEPYQDNGSQSVVLEDLVWKNNILFGFGETGMPFFGNSTSIAGLTPTQQIVINSYVGGGRGRAFILQNLQDGVDRVFRNIKVGSLLKKHDDLPNAAEAKDIFVKSGTVDDTVKAFNTTFPTGHLLDPDSFLNESAFNSIAANPDPEFTKSGFVDDDITEWLEWSALFGRTANSPLGSILSTADQGGGITRITTNAAHGLTTGNYVMLFFTNMDAKYQITVIDSTHFDVTYSWSATSTGAWQQTYQRTFTIGVSIAIDPNDGKKYKCISTYTADIGDSSPKDDVTHWELLRWDGNGVRSDEVGYDSGTARDEMPYDFRLTANSIYNKLGMGFDNAPNTDYEYFQWFRCDDANKTNPKRIPGATHVKLKLVRFSQIKSGEYVYRNHVHPIKGTVSSKTILIP